jgi:hypothetical protein
VVDMGWLGGEGAGSADYGSGNAPACCRASRVPWAEAL